MRSNVTREARYPSLEELARTLASVRPHGVLATLDASGHPYTSVIELAALGDGTLLTLLSDLAQHSKNLGRDARASVSLREPHSAPLAHPRVSLKGTFAPTDKPPHRDLYLARHPKASSYLEMHDFRFYRFTLEAVYIVAGFGRMGWRDAAAYHAAESDPLIHIAAGAVQHMNEDHPHNLLDYARAFLRLEWAEHARMLTLDRYGFDLEIRGGTKGTGKLEKARLSFTEPLQDAADLRPLMVNLAREARAHLEGGA